MRVLNTILFLVLSCALLGGVVQAQQTDPKNTPSTPLVGERDNAAEDQIAKLFEKVRKDAKLPSVSRIKNRDSMVQNLCSIFQKNPIPDDARVLYTTPHPDSVTPELVEHASFNKLKPRYNPSLHRYSVAVWRMADPQTHEPVYWVAIGFYPSAEMEFFMNHFTDDMYYRNEWKKRIVPACVGQ
jgi:hypothetical protein